MIDEGDEVYGYRLLCKLGGGSFGQVWKVSNSGKEYAMKIISGDEKVAELERTFAENIKLRCPFLVKYHKSFRKNPKSTTLFIVMELCSEGDLSKLVKTLDKRRVLSLPHLKKIMIECLVALHELHGYKVIHRDIKLENIFMDAEFNIKLGDFGCSAILEGTYDVARTMVGTCSYMSPEISQNLAYDGKTDVWSMGVVFYCLCTLEMPFPGTSPMMIMNKITKGEYTPITDEMYPAEIGSIVHAMLQKVLRWASQIDYSPGKKLIEWIPRSLQTAIAPVATPASERTAPTPALQPQPQEQLTAAWETDGVSGVKPKPSSIFVATPAPTPATVTLSHPKPQPHPKQQLQPQPKPKRHPQPQPQLQPQPQPQPQLQLQTRLQPQPQPRPQPLPQPQAKPQPLPQPKPKQQPQPQPQPKLQPKSQSATPSAGSTPAPAPVLQSQFQGQLGSGAWARKGTPPPPPDRNDPSTLWFEKGQTLEVALAGRKRESIRSMGGDVVFQRYGARGTSAGHYYGHKLPNLVYADFREVAWKELPPACCLGMESLRNVELPFALEIVSEHAFQGCMISEIYFPETLKSVQQLGLAYSDVNEVAFPPGFRTLDYESFGFCRSLRRVELPSDMELIDYAFPNTELEMLTVGDVEKWVFDDDGIPDYRPRTKVKELRLTGKNWKKVPSELANWLEPNGRVVGPNFVGKKLGSFFGPRFVVMKS